MEEEAKWRIIKEGIKNDPGNERIKLK